MYDIFCSQDIYIFLILYQIKKKYSVVNIPWLIGEKCGLITWEYNWHNRHRLGIRT